jgi:hypothetical protein
MTMINNNMLANLANITASGIAKLKTFCADLGLSNLTSDGKATAARLSMPNYGAVVDYTGSWGNAITTDVDGWLWVNGSSAPGTQSLYIGPQTNFVTVYMNGIAHTLNGIIDASNTNIVSNVGGAWFPVKAGNAFQVVNGDGNSRQILFYPCLGES